MSSTASKKIKQIKMANRVSTWIVLTIIVATLGGCGLSTLQTPDEFVVEYGISTTKRSGFSLCYGYGCPKKMEISLNDEEWRPIREIFTPAATDAETERQRIAAAVQRLENITGKKTGINSDIGGTFPAAFQKGQMDCEDEAINTNVFLLLLEDDNLLKFHRIYGIARRGTFPFGWPPHGRSHHRNQYRQHFCRRLLVLRPGDAGSRRRGRKMVRWLAPGQSRFREIF